MLLRKNIVSVQVESLLMPESDGPEILRITNKALTWTFNKLECTLKQLNKDIKVAWDHFNISGHSFGGLLALYVFSTISLHPLKPTTFRIKVVHVRSPLTRPYTRQEGQFMGVSVSQHEAEGAVMNLRSTMAALKREGSVIIKRAGSIPPFAMNMAYNSSVSRAEGATWLDFWNEASMYDLLNQMTVCPDEGATIVFEHGTADVNVPYQNTLDTITMLKAKFPKLDIHGILIEGKDHAWDYDRELSELLWVFEKY
jgi:hypothetical protein